MDLKTETKKGKLLLSMFLLIPNKFLIQDTDCSCYLISNGLGTIIKFAGGCLQMLIATGRPLLTLRPRSRHHHQPIPKNNSSEDESRAG